jgi:hypothetical protein
VEEHEEGTKRQRGEKRKNVEKDDEFKAVTSGFLTPTTQRERLMERRCMYGHDSRARREKEERETKKGSKNKMIQQGVKTTVREKCRERVRRVGMECLLEEGEEGEHKEIKVVVVPTRRRGRKEGEERTTSAKGEMRRWRDDKSREGGTERVKGGKASDL